MFKTILYKKIFLHSIENLDVDDNFVYISKVKTPWFKQVAYQRYNVKTYQIFNFPQWLNFDNFVLINKQLNQLQFKLSFQTKYGTAKTRIQNQLSYKLGQVMIVNSKSLLGYIIMPFVLSYIKDKHTQEQKIYQEKIKKDPSLKLPPPIRILP